MLSKLFEMERTFIVLARPGFMEEQLRETTKASAILEKCLSLAADMGWELKSFELRAEQAPSEGRPFNLMKMKLLAQFEPTDPRMLEWSITGVKPQE